MRKAISLAVSLCLSAGSVWAQASAPPGLGWNQGGQVVTNDMPFVTVSNQSSMSQERALAVGSGLSLTDNGANSSISIGLGSVLSYFHGTGATTQQSAANAILNFSGLTSQDVIYFDGTNWSRLAKGSNGQVLGINGSGNLAYISPAGSGTVTSVGIIPPSWLTVSGSPVTGAGDITLGNGTGLTANRIVGTDGSGNLDLMALTSDQVPSLAASKITSGNLAKARSATEGVYNDQSNTYAGAYTQDFSDASQNVKLPLRAVATSNGSVSVDSSDLAFYAGAAAHKAAKQATTFSAGTGLTGGGDFSTNRTIALDTPVSAANGGTGADLSGATTGAIVYKGASALTSLSPFGNGGKFIRFNSGATAPEAASIADGFSGDGSDGAVTKGATTETTVLQVNSTTFTQTVSTTWAPISKTQVMATSTIDLNGTTNVATGCAGGINGDTTERTRRAAHGSGLSGGQGGWGATAQSAGGGGGGGFGGAGGYGGAGNNNQAYPGGAGGSTNDGYWGGPSGGGAGASGYGPAAGGNGGAGGGSICFRSVGALTLGGSSTVNADGAAGSAQGADEAGGGGGGSGGLVALYSQTSITLTSGCNVYARGGAGGNGGTYGGKGGGGGGGKVVRVAPTITGSGTVTVTGGSAAGTGAGTAAAGGSGVNLSITDTPTIMLTKEIEGPHIDLLYRWRTAFGDIKPGEELRLNSARPAAVWCAQFYPAEKREALVNEWLFGEDLSGGKTATIEKREDLNDAA